MYCDHHSILLLYIEQEYNIINQKAVTKVSDNVMNVC